MPAAKRVLLIEDDAGLRQALKMLLERRGYLVVEALDGREALTLLQDDPLPSAVLLDLKLPGMNGWEFRERQLADPRLACLPTLVMTGDEAEPSGALHGATLYPKSKPPQQLLDAVETLVAQAPKPGARRSPR